ncbi:MAG: radical SAM protein [Planctomycetota bacterium]
MPDFAPLSINLDLTTACNYRCDHCIDWDILNQAVKHKDATLRNQMTEMAARGLRSVILIGGGEPTLYPGFPDFVKHLKSLGLQVAVVSNGSRGDKLLEIAPYLEAGDWIRLSLDSGSNEVFRAMHKPSKASTDLDEICSWVPKIKRVNPSFQLGFSFIITWKGGTRDDVHVIENIHEIELAAKRAHDAKFDYISLKPFLERSDTGSEVMEPEKTEARLQEVTARIQSEVAAAKKFEHEGFSVRESTNLRVLIEGNWRDYTNQPQVCHMQAMRQVVSPHGTFNCPAYRGVDYARIGDMDVYHDEDSCREGADRTTVLLDHFDAKERCGNVTCIYNRTNWWMEELIESGTDLESVEVLPDTRDTFL